MPTIRVTIFLLLALGLVIVNEAFAAGQYAWETMFPESEAPYFVRVDNAGNVYVIGRYFVETPENAEIFVKKYMPGSTLVWSDTTSGIDLKIPIAAAVDQQGNVYVLAQLVSDTVSPVIVYRFDSSDGDVAWGQPFYPPGEFKQSAARDLIVDANGNIVVCANFVIDDPLQPLRFDTESFVLCYSNGGSLLWSHQGALVAPSITFERLKTGNGTIYVIGTFQTFTDDYDGFVAGYTLDGDSLFTVFSGLNPQNGVYSQGNAIDSSGNLLAIFSDNDSTIYRKFSPTGNSIFGPMSLRLGFNFKNAVCSDRLDNFYWIVNDDQGNQILQSRNAGGDLVVDLSIGNVPSPYPIVFGGDNTLLTWSEDNRVTQYGPNGGLLWQSAEIYSSVGDYVSSGNQSYWILYLYDDVIPDLLYRKLVKYELGSNCGDVDASNQLNITDAVFCVNYIFANGLAPMDRSHGDFDCNNQTDITDIVYMINYFFASGPAPCANCP
ncbi:MAG: hypothetical protein WBP29_03595 [Candidatus Zixiibacteriota bacterium]